MADGQVTFRWKDYGHGSKHRTMAVSGEEFLRRFLLHVLPRGFVRIRFFGFLANRRRPKLLPMSTVTGSQPLSKFPDTRRRGGQATCFLVVSTLRE